MITHHSGQAEAETQRGHNLSVLMPTPWWTSQRVTELSRPSVAGNFKICKSSRDLRKEGDNMGANVLILTNFLSRWPGCERKLAGWEVSRNQRLISGIVQWHKQTNSTTLRPCKWNKISKVPTLNDRQQKHARWERLDPCCHSEQEEPPPYAWSAPTQQIWDYGVGKREDSMGNGSNLERDNHTELVQPRTQVKTSAIKKRQRVLVNGNSELSSNETHIFCLDNLSREVWCLLRATIWDIWKRILGMMKLEDYYMLMVFPAGSRDAATRKLQNIKRDLMSFGKMVKGMRASVILWLILSVRDWDTGRKRRMDLLNEELCGWSHLQVFEYYNPGHAFERLSNSTSDVLQLTWRDKNILGSNLVGLTTSALS